MQKERKKSSRLLTFSFATALLTGCTGDLLPQTPLSPEEVTSHCRESYPIPKEEIGGADFRKAINAAEGLDNYDLGEISKALTLGDMSNNISPDGKSALYSSFSRFQITIIDKTGGNIQRITNPLPGFEDREPKWSLDGSKIVFERHDNQNNNNDIYVIDPTTKKETPLTHNPPHFHSYFPQFLLNGRVIFMTEDNRNTDKTGYFVQNEVFTVNPDGTDIQKIQLGESASHYLPREFWLSPNHARVALMAYPKMGHVQNSGPIETPDAAADFFIVTDNNAKKIDSSIDMETLNPPSWTKDSSFVKYAFANKGKSTTFLEAADGSANYTCPHTLFS